MNPDNRWFRGPVVSFECTTDVIARRRNLKGVNRVSRWRREYMLCCLTLFSSEDNKPIKVSKRGGESNG